MNQPPPAVATLRPVLMRRLRTIAEIAARAGGAIAKRYLGGNSLAVELKPDRSEVSTADHAAQRRVVEVVRRFRPNDPIIGEEGDLKPVAAMETDESGAFISPAEAEELASDAGPLPHGPIWWIIDPIDGTRNFVRGLPGFGCAVAAMYAGIPVAAATYDAYIGRVYSTSWLDPLLIDDWPATLSGSEWRADTRVKPVLGIPSGANGRHRAIVMQWIDRYLVRNYGAAALHMAYVAAGGLDGTLNADTRLWDIAGGWLLVLRGGGKVTTLDGGPVFPIDVARYQGEPIPCLATSSLDLHARLLADAP
jgi:myo-inositol-1(or 4)-monophosphatase